MAFTDRQKQNVGHATIAGMAVGGVAGYKSLKPIRRGVAAAKGMKRAGKQAHSLSRGLGRSKPRALANAVGTAPKGRKMVRPYTPDGDFAGELGDSYKKLGGAYAGALVGGVAGGSSLERHYIKQNERSKVKKSDPFGLEEISKAKDMSAYREKEWRTPGEGKKLRRARLKNVAEAGGSAGLGAVAAGRGRSGRGALAGGAAWMLGGNSGVRAMKHEKLMDKPYKRYKKAGGTDTVPKF